MTNKAKPVKRTKQSTSRSFEEAIKELEDIVNNMSSGDQHLETALGEFEKGVEIVRECQDMLKQAQQRIEQVTKFPDGKFEKHELSSQDSDR